MLFTVRLESVMDNRNVVDADAGLKMLAMRFKRNKMKQSFSLSPMVYVCISYSFFTFHNNTSSDDIATKTKLQKSCNDTLIIFYKINLIFL